MKRKVYSMILALLLILNPLVPCQKAPIVSAENVQTLTITDNQLYKKLKSESSSLAAPVFLPKSAAQYDDQNQTITLDTDAVTGFNLNLSGVSITEENRSIISLLFQVCTNLQSLQLDRCDLSAFSDDDFSGLYDKSSLEKLRLIDCTPGKTVIINLFKECTNLKELRLNNCDLSAFGDDDFSGLNNRNSLTTLCLVNCKLEQFPAVTLPELTAMCLTSNPLSAEDACKNISAGHLPKLSSLYLDGSKISEISFLESLGTLKTLSIGDSRLTDDSLSTLLDMSGSLPDIVNLNLGLSRHTDIIWTDRSLSAGSSLNQISNTGNLAMLTSCFPKLKELDLSGLRISSLQDFAGIRDDISIDFRKNQLTDFAGCEKNYKYNYDSQEIDFPDLFAAGWANEIPELMKRVMDENDALHGRLSYSDKKCDLSDDGNRLVIPSNSKGTLCVNVNSGRLWNAKFTFSLKKLTPPAITEDLTAHEGDTLAQLVLPDGYTWQNPAQDVGTAGSHTFPADCTMVDNGHTYIKYGIDISVTVLSDADPTPTPTVPVTTPGITSTPPTSPTSTPLTPTPTIPAVTPTPTIPAVTPTPTIPAKPPAPTPHKTTAGPTPTAPAISTQVPTNTPAPLTPTPSKLPDTPSPVKTPAASTQSPLPPTPAIPTPTPTSLSPVPTPTAQVQTASPTLKPDESGLTGNQIEKRKDLSLLLATGIQTGKHRIKLTWREKNGCSGYEVYWSFCDGKQNFKKLKTVDKDGKRVCYHTQLQRNRAYKYYIATYTIQDGRKNYQSKSPSIHIAMKKEPHTNAKRIKVNRANVTLTETDSFQIKATAVLENKKKKLLNHEKKFRYYVDNRDVASVNQKGKIQAKQKGTCTVFVITNNGVSKQIQVTVK